MAEIEEIEDSLGGQGLEGGECECEARVFACLWLSSQTSPKNSSKLILSSSRTLRHPTISSTMPGEGPRGTLRGAERVLEASSALVAEGQGVILKTIS